MNSTAFVSTTPVLARTVSSSSVSANSFAPSRTPHYIAAVPSSRRGGARITMKKIEKEEHTVPEGFTFFSENLNGRAAMVGFALAVITEAITGKGIVGQLYGIVEALKGNNPAAN